MTKPNWFKMSSKGDTANISIYDEIGTWGVSASDFRDTLNGLGDGIKTINLDINSPGGVVFDGLSIYNMLKRHPATVNARVDGIAASIASVVLMAGDTRSMPENAMVMVHNPEGIVAGNSDDMKDMADLLDKIRDNVSTVYMSATGMDQSEVVKMMADVTWMNASEAKANGFATSVTKPSTVKNKFDLARHGAPDAVCRLYGKVKMAADDTPPPVKTDDPPDPKEVQTEPPDEKPAVEAAAEARNRAADIVAACELAGQPKLALGYINGDKPLTEIMAELQSKRIDASNKEINPHSGGGAAVPDASWGKTINRLNARRKVA